MEEWLITNQKTEIKKLPNWVTVSCLSYTPLFSTVRRAAKLIEYIIIKKSQVLYREQKIE